jgi:hypothetical protein
MKIERGEPKKKLLSDDEMEQVKREMIAVGNGFREFSLKEMVAVENGFHEFSFKLSQVFMCE